MRMSNRTGSYTAESHFRSKADVPFSQRSAIALSSTPHTIAKSAAISHRIRE